uniref:Uncharacterized protein n=1 Tax=Tanacetum cinerariifolium TaxID=118510 RepID=A0A6L2KKQ5_TANCI|nr:hypothetical protein [Tanacetum cinerariifolium]
MPWAINALIAASIIEVVVVAVAVAVAGVVLVLVPLLEAIFYKSQENIIHPPLGHLHELDLSLVVPESDRALLSASSVVMKLKQPSFGVDAVEDFKEYTLRDYYCWLKTCCWYKLKLLDNVVDTKLRLLEESAADDDKMKK